VSHGSVDRDLAILHVAELTAPATEERVVLFPEEDLLGVDFAVAVIAVPDSSLNACHPLIPCHGLGGRPLLPYVPGCLSGPFDSL
jgi:hypothetical protein